MYRCVVFPTPLALTQFFKGNLSLPDLKNHCQTFKKTFGEAMSIESWVSCLSDSEGSKTNFRFVGSGQSVVFFSDATSVGPQRDDRPPQMSVSMSGSLSQSLSLPLSLSLSLSLS